MISEAESSAFSQRKLCDGKKKYHKNKIVIQFNTCKIEIHDFQEMFIWISVWMCVCVCVRVCVIVDNHISEPSRLILTGQG